MTSCVFLRLPNSANADGDDGGRRFHHAAKRNVSPVLCLVTFPHSALTTRSALPSFSEHQPFKVFLGGVSYSTTEESLRGYLEQFGEVDSVVIMTDRNTGRPRGFGFATFTNQAAVDRVIAEPHLIDGRTVEAKVATPVGSTVPRGFTDQGGALPINLKKVFVGGLPDDCDDACLKVSLQSTIFLLE